MAGINFIILKINGLDVSQMPHEEAVQLFLKAPEPILVEVRRRQFDDIMIKDNYNSGQLTSMRDNTNFNNKLSNSMPSTPLRIQNQSKHYQNHQQQQQQHHHQHNQKQQSDLNNSQNSIKSNNSICQNIHKPNPQFLSLPTSPAHHSNHTNHKYNELIASPDTLEIGITTNRYDDNNGSNNIASGIIDCNNIYGDLNNSTELYRNQKLYKSIAVQTETFTTDFIFNGGSIVDDEMIRNEHNFFEECLAPEIDIEEVTLRKSKSNERIGLTVSYSSGNGSGSDDTTSDTCTEVYISDIIPDSIAARDGRLRQGDQILQVNGRDVSNKEETESLLSENKNAVTLLVSRCLYTDEDFNDPGDYYDEDERNLQYENCLIENCAIEDNLSTAKAIMSQKPQTNNANVVDHMMTAAATTTVNLENFNLKQQQQRDNQNLLTAALSPTDPLNHFNIRAHLDSVNQEMALLDSRVENMMLHSCNNTTVATATTTTTNNDKSQQILNTKEQQQQINGNNPLTIITNNIYRMPIDTKRDDTTTPTTATNNRFYDSNTLTTRTIKCSHHHHGGGGGNSSDIIHKNSIKHLAAVTNVTNITTTTTTPAAAIPPTTKLKTIDSDTEHIYETIPEDTESEPVYCSPYESSDQNIVEQWLDMQDNTTTTTTTTTITPQQIKLKKKLMQLKPLSKQQQYIWQKTENTLTNRSNNSSCDDHENSSSAYNTGGSCNSNNQLTLELNSNGGGNLMKTNHDHQQQQFSDHYHRSTLVFCSPTTIENQQQFHSHHQHHHHHHHQDMMNDNNCKQCQMRPKKDKTIINNSSTINSGSSPKHCQKLMKFFGQSNQSKPIICKESHTRLTVEPPRTCTTINKTTNDSCQPTGQITSDTMYTNVANLQQTMLLQQKLFRQALVQQSSTPTETTIIQQQQQQQTSGRSQNLFTAPNLSNYHFVSSQEQQVQSVAIKPSPNDEQMQWKVKRRQDGTRYIVRRPVRNRMMRDRAMRITEERNELTTEDDTISEIKTGRYWTKDERKKHIERAKERRNRQQIMILNKNAENSTNMNAQSYLQMQQHQLALQQKQLALQQQQLLQQQHQIASTTSSATNKISSRQTAATSSIATGINNTTCIDKNINQIRNIGSSGGQMQQTQQQQQDSPILIGQKKTVKRNKNDPSNSLAIIDNNIKINNPITPSNSKPVGILSVTTV